MLLPCNHIAAVIKSFKIKYIENNLLFCIIEATPDSHVAWLWYSKRHKEITKVVSSKSENWCTDLFYYYYYCFKVSNNLQHFFEQQKKVSHVVRFKFYFFLIADLVLKHLLIHNYDFVLFFK